MCSSYQSIFAVIHLMNKFLSSPK